MERHRDPVTPFVTFDNYVIPETVQSGARKPSPPAVRLTGLMAAVGVIAALTFLLGVMAAQKFTTGGAAVAQRPAEPAVYASEETVTRQQSPDLISTLPVPPKAAIGSDQPAVLQAVLQGLQPKRTVGKLTEDELAQRAVEAQAMVNRNKLRMLREGVLAGLYTVRTLEEGGTRRLVLTTVNAEMTRASMGNLLLEAAQRGEIEIPASLSTADGEIDMDTMLFNLIQTSLAQDGTPEGAEAARDMSRRAFAASDARTTQVRGQRIYQVRPGDSLAYISLQFYGRPNAYARIFAANSEQLSSPDLIKVGQRLIIPE